MSSPVHHPPEYIPWYNRPQHDVPFSLIKKLSSPNLKPETFRSIAPFPWNLDSASTLWDGEPGECPLYMEPGLSRWKEMLSEFSDAVAVGSQNKLYIFFLQQKLDPISINLPPLNSKTRLLPSDCISIAWILGPRAPFEPLVVFSRGSITCIYNVKRKGIASYLRGHGRVITSIAVHPTRPNLFCTTSRDTSVRIYDLVLTPQQYPQNPHWPPSKHPSLAGAAHGLHMSESEGRGLGRCVVVLMGGRSGGHRGAVLGAAFHPKMPIIATCGLDRVVKIWHVPPLSQVSIKREDKPLFSSSRIHNSHILSINWLQNDVLITHSAPATMRVNPDDVENKQTNIEPGQVIVWRWLGIDRFFPPDQEETRQESLRGCSSDYQESSAFKILSVSSFPPVGSMFIVPKLNIFQSPVDDALAVYTFPQSSSCFIFSISRALARKSSSLFKQTATDTSGISDRMLVRETERMHVNDDASGGAAPNHIDSNKEHDASIPPQLPGRELSIPSHMVSQFGGRLENCAFTMDGSVLIGVGTEGTVWVWKLSMLQ